MGAYPRLRLNTFEFSFYSKMHGSDPVLPKSYLCFDGNFIFLLFGGISPSSKFNLKSYRDYTYRAICYIVALHLA